MDPVLQAFVFTLIGFGLSFAPPWFDRRRKIVTHWEALRAEAMLCVEKAKGYLAAAIAAPLYRLPTIAFEKAFPVLLVEGEISEAESLAINRFFSQAQDINRGLDNANSHLQADRDALMAGEYGRLRIKATELALGDDGLGGLSSKALAIFDAKIKAGRLSR